MPHPEFDSHNDISSTALLVQRLVVTMHDRFGITMENLDTMEREDVLRTIAGWQFIINNLPDRIAERPLALVDTPTTT